ncbi:MAG: Holliday junction resolvase RuvX [Phycisphaeraceae bacterium]|nr:Holliday junction resolvase RuvX [Phycisphaeraceae bacterium]
MRYLAIDLGDKRTGLAVGDDETRIVSPFDVIQVPLSVNGGDALLGALARAIEEILGYSAQSKGELIVGLPLNMDGTEGPRSKVVRSFAARLGARVKRPIRFQDERLSSAAADWSMAGSGLTRGEKKEKRDALAAAAILNDFLATIPPKPRPNPPPGP